MASESSSRGIPQLEEAGVNGWHLAPDKEGSCSFCARHARGARNFADLGGGLLLGAYDAASCPYVLQSLGVTHVVQVMKKSWPIRPPKFVNFEYFVIDVDDRDEEAEKLAAAWDDAFEFISAALKSGRGKVYVHCFAGVSRSPTVCIAYLMKEKGMRLEDADRTMPDKLEKEL
ncbi:dual specificity protein phosphatase [Klebsormidium nitens]|uniref:protein-tyrosine-phosphatase n=1 Tax=Klebsormidium nitens TaxID=105231 RepID=A0A1Y1HVG0_KLENI|nr:dual specificity protein phosphatase [Klebsormidium nitens]|eukprot:GAQ80516.1 dual specificity protein phosphatase [Klebsormidium nitens]